MTNLVRSLAGPIGAPKPLSALFEPKAARNDMEYSIHSLRLQSHFSLDKRLASPWISKKTMHCFHQLLGRNEGENEV